MPQASRPPALVIKNLYKRWGKYTAVNDVSLEVSEGEFVFLIGPSGCGKTTTLRMIGGYETPTSGEIILRGRRLNDVPLERRNIGMVFQNYALFPHMTVRQNVEFGLRMRKLPAPERRERAESTLDLVELTGFADRYPIQLSGGQRQRVAIARVLAFEPDILLLDEPLANLDKRLRDTMRVELKKLQEKVGITSIYVTHDQEEALSMADRIAVMEDGILLQLGAPREVYNSPSTNFVASFLGETTKLAGAVERLDRKFAHIATKGGFHVTVANNGTMQQGDEMVVSVRPERVRLSRSKPAQEENVLAGTVDFVSYLGAHVTYIVRIEGGDVLLKADEQLTSGLATFEEGDKVYASWDAASTVCLRC
jgi:spermidine/putrescine ABC transporter ATP-binding subunit